MPGPVLNGSKQPKAQRLVLKSMSEECSDLRVAYVG